MTNRRRFGILIVLILIAEIFLKSPIYAANSISTFTFKSKVSGISDVKLEINFPSELNCDWMDPENDDYGYCATSVSPNSTNTTSNGKTLPSPQSSSNGNPFASGIKYRFVELGTATSNSFFWRVTYYSEGKAFLSDWKNFREISFSNDFIQGSDEAFRFYGPGEMQIEFRGWENSDCYTANCSGYVNGFTLQPSSFPRIKLLGLTKNQAIAKRKSLDESNYNLSKLEELKWEFGKFDDGIDRFIYIDQVSDYSNGIGGENTLRIYCQNRKLGAWISVHFANSIGRQGVAKIRFDSRPIKNLNYTLGRNFDLISINYPKTFISEFIKSKKVIVKILTVRGSDVPTFSVGNLVAYKKVFAAKGCNF